VLIESRPCMCGTAMSIHMNEDVIPPMLTCFICEGPLTEYTSSEAYTGNSKELLYFLKYA